MIGRALRTVAAVAAGVIAVPVLAVGASVTATEEAAAATGCQISVRGLPSTVTIDATNRRYWVRATATDCPRLDTSYSDVWADLYGPSNLRNRTYNDLLVDFDSSSHEIIWTSDLKAGRYTLLDIGSSIVDDDFNDLHYTWVRKAFTAKYRSYTTMSAKRRDRTVRLSGSVRRFSPNDFGYVAYRRPVAVQRYTHGAWHTLKTVWSTHGRYSYSYTTKRRYAYRAKIAATTTTLGSKSATHTVGAAR